MHQQYPFHHKFSIGEIVIVSNVNISDAYYAYIGTECTVIKHDPYRAFGNLLIAYEVQLCDGIKVGASEENLRRRPQPSEDREIVRWADCPWQPAQHTELS